MIQNATQCDTKKTVKKLRTTQVVGCRISKNQWHQFEQKCLAHGKPMSVILQQAVVQFINN